MSDVVDPSRDGTHLVDVRQQDRSIGELFADLTRDMSLLLRKEVELAKVEVKEQAARGGRAGGMLGATAVAAYLSVLFLSFALAWGLAAVMPDGLAFLIVGVLYAAAAAVMYVKGREELDKLKPVPEQTIETLKEDVQWARQQMS